jgi:hypothetical protein
MGRFSHPIAATSFMGTASQQWSIQRNNRHTGDIRILQLMFLRWEARRMLCEVVTTDKYVWV